ncbi:hypothetical protein [Actinoplanes rectilineatus]|uniref:hypothetical protein n=1 Tax=Actinoplanes rectilineatus TaxID=113571 RepID=UPI0005F2F729|nr:hypothetical protein [Actinoplanes rectilineatus]
MSSIIEMAGWARERAGRTVVAVTASHHWFEGRRNDSGPVHIWLHFDDGRVTALHGMGDHLWAFPEDVGVPVDLGEHGEIRVAAAEPPDPLARLVGARLREVRAVPDRFDPDRCTGIHLAWAGGTLYLGSEADEWIIQPLSPVYE